MRYLGRKFFHRTIGLGSEFQKARCQNCKTFPHLTSLELHQQAVQEIARLRTQLEEECNCIGSLTYLCECRKLHLLQILAHWYGHSYILQCLSFVVHFVYCCEDQFAHGRSLTFLLCHQDRSLSTRLVAISSESRPVIGLHLLLKKEVTVWPTY